MTTQPALSSQEPITPVDPAVMSLALYEAVRTGQHEALRAARTPPKTWRR